MMPCCITRDFAISACHPNGKWGVGVYGISRGADIARVSGSGITCANTDATNQAEPGVHLVDALIVLTRVGGAVEAIAALDISRAGGASTAARDGGSGTGTSGASITRCAWVSVIARDGGTGRVYTAYVLVADILSARVVVITDGRLPTSACASDTRITCGTGIPVVACIVRGRKVELVDCADARKAVIGWCCGALEYAHTIYRTAGSDCISARSIDTHIIGASEAIVTVDGAITACSRSASCDRVVYAEVRFTAYRRTGFEWAGGVVVAWDVAIGASDTGREFRELDSRGLGSAYGARIRRVYGASRDALAAYHTEARFNVECTDIVEARIGGAGEPIITL